MSTHKDVTDAANAAMTSDPAPDPAHVAIWVALNRARLSLMRQVDKKLRDTGLPPLTWYDVLWAIERRGGAARPADVLEDLLFEPSALSHMSRRMEAAGLVQICVAETDRRGRVLRITEAGLQARAAIWKIYGKALETQLRPLSQLDDPAAVAAALTEVIAARSE